MTELGILFLHVMFYADTAFAGLISGIAMHEFIHLFVYRKRHGLKGYFVKTRMGLAFVRPDDDESLFLKAGGALTVGLAGACGLAIIWIFDINSIYLLVLFITYALHFIELLPFWGDGRGALKIICKKVNKCSKADKYL